VGENNVARYGTSTGRRGGHTRRNLAPSRGRKSPTRRDQRGGGVSHRAVWTIGSLVGVLSLTSVLLRAIQGAVMTPDAAYGMASIKGRAGLGGVFATQVGAQPSRWKAIYIHHSKTPGGNAATVSLVDGACGDHFVIGNGEGAADGEIQFTQRWDLQQAADPAPGVARVDPACITVCLAGDFDSATPTATQLKRLGQLVQTLQERHRISASQVWVLDVAGSAAGVGKYFPTGAFSRQLLK